MWCVCDRYSQNVKFFEHSAILNIQNEVNKTLTSNIWGLEKDTACCEFSKHKFVTFQAWSPQYTSNKLDQEYWLQKMIIWFLNGYVWFPLHFLFNLCYFENENWTRTESILLIKHWLDRKLLVCQLKELCPINLNLCIWVYFSSSFWA